MFLRQNLTVFEGDTWSFVYTYLDSAGNPVDLTGYSARMAVRRVISGGLHAYLSTGADAVGGSIALGGSTGIVTLSMTATQSDSLLHTTDLAGLMAGQNTGNLDEMFIYDLELIAAGGDVTRILGGDLILVRSVTK